MRRVGRRLWALLLLWSVAALVQAGERLYLWEVKGQGDGPGVHLFGSVHLCRADCFPLPPAVLAAFDQAHFLGVELDPQKAGVQDSLLQGARYGDDDGLQNHVDAQLLAQIKTASLRLGMAPDTVLKMKPWMASTTLTVIGALRAGFRAEDGIDLWFIDRARKAGKAVVELETVAQQLESLDAIPPPQQQLLLAQSVRLASGDGLRGYFDGLIGAWRSGDDGALYRMSQTGIDDSAAAEDVLHALLAARNGAMTQRIVRLMATGRPGFVVVGALHLAGRASIVELLRSRGYQVRQVEAP